MDEIDRVISRIKLRHLRIFIAVAGIGNMGRAAEVLAISQPVVSKAVAELEAMVGVQLVDRGPKGVTPTLYGEALVKRSVALFNDLRSSLIEIESLSDPNAGELRIGCSEVFSGSLLPTIISTLSRSYPRLSIHVISGDLLTMLNRDLRVRNIELMIGRVSEEDLGDDTDTEILFQDRLEVVAGGKNPLARRESNRPSDFKSASWCLPPPETNPGKFYLDWFRVQGMDYPTNRVTALSLQLQFGLLSASNFLTLLPHSMVQFSAHRRSVKSLRTKQTAYLWPVGVVTLKQRTTSPAARIFIECTRKLSKSLLNQ